MGSPISNISDCASAAVVHTAAAVYAAAVRGCTYDYDERLRLLLRLYDWEKYDTINDTIESVSQINIPT